MSVIFVIRCLLALWFGGRIVALSGLASEETFDLLADYLLIDGLLGIALGVSYLRQAHARGARREWTLGVIFAADAVGRSLAGTAIHLWPGIAGFPVTAVVFIGIMAACTAAVGFGELVVAGEEELARHERHARAQFVVAPTVAASAIALAFGIAALVSIDDFHRGRALIGAYIIASGAVMLSMARRPGNP